MDKSEQAKASLVDEALLDKVDKLFACGVGSHVALPQLVVVGDQSSGKSSVLEGLTRLPFPRDSTLCTRFATQVTFRRSSDKKLAVTILPSEDDGGSQEQIRSYKREAETLTDTTFREIMEEVRTLMGLEGQARSATSSSFSDHVLKIEVCGPDEEHLSVIDVPGIFEKTTEGVTTKMDIALVKAMVERYMQNPRSVMLVVVPANVDTATQKILTMAEEADADGHRTLGVLTKPDLVDTGAEQNVLDLLNNRNHKLALGWCIVRNPGQQQLQQTKFDRSAQEQLFFKAKAPWNSLNKDRIGIDALKIRLRDICASHIRREFPKVKLEIGKKLVEARKKLLRFGEKRDSAETQRQYLLKMCMDFQEITNFALTANYNASKYFDMDPSLRLATLVINRSELLSDAMQAFGHLHPFHGGRRNDSETGDDDISGDDSSHESNVEPDLCEFHTVDIHPDLLDMTYDNEFEKAEPDSSIMKWLSTLFKASRGFELGTLNASILATAMKVQSRNWEGFAQGYVVDIVSMVHEYLTSLLNIVCAGDSRAHDGILALLMDPLLERYKAAIRHVDFLLHVELTGTPATMNHYFSDNLEKNRQIRLRDALMSKAFELGTERANLPVRRVWDEEQDRYIKVKSTKHKSVSIDPLKCVRMDDIVQNSNISNSDYTVQLLHDILKSYYKVARKRFVDNLHTQAADYYLLTGHDNPLKLFNAAFVGRLSEEQLEEVAGEDAVLRRQRESLEKEIEDLEEGKKILR